jgi:hypothetical protein
LSDVLILLPVSVISLLEGSKVPSQMMGFEDLIEAVPDALVGVLVIVGCAT